jgi:ribosomal protein S18 acetylase RimI-like enzyme
MLQEDSKMANRPHFRLTAPQDAFALAELANFAGYGMQLYLWEKLAEAGQSPWDVGRKRAAREHGSFPTETPPCEHEGQIAGCLIGYQIADIPESIDPKLPPMFRPMQELENLAPGTWHVNILAVLPSLRNKGFGAELLQFADEIGQRLGKRGMSVIVSDANVGGRRLYERCGYRETAKRHMVKENWINDGQNWVLLTKEF